VNEETTTQETWKGRRVVVVGMARSGQAVARLLARHGARVRGTDLKDAGELGLDPGELERGGIELRLGSYLPGDIEAAEVAVVSPGIPKTSSVLQDAMRIGLPVLSELEVAARFARAPIAAVTGTNGKSTTVTVLGQLVAALGHPVAVAGNVGRALSDAVETVPENGFLVVEVSSFQLEDVDRFHPRVAAVLNLAPDHLDRYASFDDYVEAKLRILVNLGREDTAIVPVGDPRLDAAVAGLDARILRFGGSDVENGIAWVDGNLVKRWGGVETLLLPLDEIALPGAHNQANVASALCLLEGLGLDASDSRVLAAVRTLEGLPHRMERVAEMQGVIFYNDSKATNPDSMRAALGALGQPVVLIAGGRAKGGDYGELSGMVKACVAGVVVLGEAAPLLAEAWGDTGVPMQHAGSDLEEAVRLAYEMAGAERRPVLFSPGCASFDMFQDFEDRGDRFREIVLGLGEGA